MKNVTSPALRGIMRRPPGGGTGSFACLARVAGIAEDLATVHVPFSNSANLHLHPWETHHEEA